MAEMLLEFYVKDQTLVRKKDGQIPRKDSEGYLFLKFNFIGQTWENLSIIPWIGYQDENKQVWSVKSDIAVDLNRYQVPVKYLGQDYFLVSLSGAGSDGTKISTNIVKVSLADAGSEIIDLPDLPEDAGGQSVVDLVNVAVSAAQYAAQASEDAIASADSAARVAADASDAANAALQAVKGSGYTDVTEDYQQNGQGDPLNYLLSLGVGSWFLDDTWIQYRVRSFDVDGTLWQIVENWSDDSFYNLNMYADGNIVYSIDTEFSQIRVGDVILPNLYFAAQAEAPSDFPNGAFWLDTDEDEPDISDAPNIVTNPDAAQDGDYWLDSSEDYVLRSEMENYVDGAIQAALAAIPNGEEMLFG